MRLLIVEDDRDAADYIARAFREVGHVADQAPDGEVVTIAEFEIKRLTDLLKAVGAGS